MTTEELAPVPHCVVTEAMRLHGIARALDADVRKWDGDEWRETVARGMDITGWLRAIDRADVADALCAEHNITRQLSMRETDPAPDLRARLREVRAALAAGRRMARTRIHLSWWTSDHVYTPKRSH